MRSCGNGGSDCEGPTVSEPAGTEFLAPLVSGGGVVMAPEGAHRDSTMMVRAVAQYGVTVLQLVPSVLQMVVNEPELADCTALRLVCSGGEPLPAALCEQLLGVVDVRCSIGHALPLVGGLGSLRHYPG